MSLCDALVWLREGVVAECSRASHQEIWRAAQRIIDLYPNDSVLAAGQRADSAYEPGDLSISGRGLNGAALSQLIVAPPEGFVKSSFEFASHDIAGLRA